MTLHFELSIMIGIRAISGSLPIRFRKRTIAASESIIASSMLTSRRFAPPCTCWRATASAASKSPAKISFENFGEPVMLVRSPMTANPNSGVILSGSRPDRERIWACGLRIADSGADVAPSTAPRLGSPSDSRAVFGAVAEDPSGVQSHG